MWYPGSGVVLDYIPYLRRLSYFSNLPNQKKIHPCVAQQASLVFQWLQTATTNLPAAWLLYQETTGL